MRISLKMKRTAKAEGVSAEFLRRGIACGRIAMPNNKKRRIAKPCAVGEGLSTKINANVGTSKDATDTGKEIKKMREALKLGSDMVMDLSTGGDIAGTRRVLLAHSKVPFGTVPVYEMAISGKRQFGSIADVPVDYMFEILERQAADGVDFFTIHAGVTRLALDVLKKNPRILDIVSRGGAFLAEWILENGRENPFYEYFDRVLDIAARHDVTLSLGDGLRPGAIADATDLAQISELVTLGELRRRALKKGVQVMIEGPGHVPIDQIEANVRLEKAICGGAPFYVLGPLVTDTAPGYDHITAAIGGAVAGAAGADFLCYVTPSEHLRLPTLEDVREGVVATKIAAHAADIAISRARRARDWKRQFELALDKARPREYRKASRPGLEDVCTMCGEYCSIKMAEKCLKR
jgi:phosphomethylpyrimidine synthase